MSIPTMIEYSVEEKYNNITGIIHKSCTNSDQRFSIVNAIIILLASYILPLILICVNYTKLALFVLKKAREVSSTQSRDKPIRHAGRQKEDQATDTINTPFILFRRRMRIVKMLTLVAGLFAVSWLPYFISLITMKITGKDDSEDSGSPLNLVKIFLATFSTAYNVVLYALFNTNFRRGFRSVLCCSKTTQTIDGVNTVNRPMTCTET
ncbi:hypothetical protein ScPMuIL_004984 [Solemya velum]